MPTAGLRNPGQSANALRSARLLFVLAILFCRDGWSLDRNLTLYQFQHHAWTIRDHAPGDVNSFAQSSDGKLWLGTSRGLLWFDGFRFEPVGGRKWTAPSNHVSTLFAPEKGGLWIGFSTGGIAYLPAEGRSVTFREREGFPSGAVHGIAEDSYGVLWIATADGLVRLEQGRPLRIGAEQGLPTGAILSSYVDRIGNLWVASSQSVFVSSPGQTSFRKVYADKAAALQRQFAQSADGGIWVNAAKGGIARVDIGSAGGPSTRAWLPDRTVARFKFDRDGVLWIAGELPGRLVVPAQTRDLSAHEAAKRVENFTRPEQSGTRGFRDVFEDREGNIWIASATGVARISASDIVKVDLPSMKGGASTIVTADSGSIWVADASGPELLKFEQGKLALRLPAPVFTAGTRDHEGGVWFGGRDAIAQVDSNSFKLIALPEHLRGFDVQAMVRDRERALWISFQSKGLHRFANGAWIAIGDLLALPKLAPLSATVDGRGDLWFGYSGDRLARVSGNTVKLFTAADGVKVGAVDALLATDQRLWVAGDLGLAGFDGARFLPLLPRTCQPFIAISGLAEAAGDLWIFRGFGLSRIPSVQHQLQGAKLPRAVDCISFGAREGLSGSAQQMRPTPSLVEASDGRLWLATTTGIAWINPTRLRVNPFVPTASISALSTPAAFHYDLSSLRLPVHTRDVRIIYSGSNLTIPEKTRFKYRLDPLDEKWRNVGRIREAVYTNLGPGDYRFEVTASNDGDVWSDPPTSIEFEILPAFYQTTWFHMACVALAVILLWMWYQLLLRRASTQLRNRLEERMKERERIARELHDTLLQGLQSLILRFHSVARRMPEHQPLRVELERALDLGDEVMMESRDRVKDLRESKTRRKDLADDIRDSAQRLSIDYPIDFEIDKDGAARELHLIVREEAMLIVREALTNAFKHSAATRIRAGIAYERSDLQLSVSDDGCGIAREVLTAGGRDGHWGLLGMHERAAKIRGTLTVTTRVGVGTVVDLKIPAEMAYTTHRRLWRWRFQTVKSSEPKSA